MRPDVEVHIEELVLRGFAPGDRDRIAEAVERELARLITDAPVSFSRSLDLPSWDAGAFQMSRGVVTESIGVQIGQAVYRSLGKLS